MTRWSQSETNPTTDFELSVRVNSDRTAHSCSSVDAKRLSGSSLRLTANPLPVPTVPLLPLNLRPTGLRTRLRFRLTVLPWLLSESNPIPFAWDTNLNTLTSPRNSWLSISTRNFLSLARLLSNMVKALNAAKETVRSKLTLITKPPKKAPMTSRTNGITRNVWKLRTPPNGSPAVETNCLLLNLAT